jgi:hypothetical protein
VFLPHCEGAHLRGRDVGRLLLGRFRLGDVSSSLAFSENSEGAEGKEKDRGYDTPVLAQPI